MNLAFANAIDPVFSIALDVLDSLERDGRVDAEISRSQILQKIDSAEASLGSSRKWLAAKYAVCAWIDERLTQSLWQEASWWGENRLETHYFQTANADYGFFEMAAESIEANDSDATEVFFLAVALGFRGVYSVPQDPVQAEFLESIGLPDSIAAWRKGVAKHLGLGEGLPPIAEAPQTPGPAAPLEGADMLAKLSMICAIVLALGIVTAVIALDLVGLR